MSKIFHTINGSPGELNRCVTTIGLVQSQYNVVRIYGALHDIQDDIRRVLHAKEGFGELERIHVCTWCSSAFTTGCIHK